MNKSKLFNHLHHICIVVEDLARTTAYYESLGIGPWEDFPPLEKFRAELDSPDIEGFMKMKYKYTSVGDVQLQLCEPGTSNTPQAEWLRTHGEGVFHLGFSVHHLDFSERHADSLGLSTLIRGRSIDGSGFNYFDTRNEAGVMLLIRANGENGT